mmetsp:Transcript_6383/g.26476  ORF Transcript_6383/g.26476 Transcript_6383/m.26476 type:complete len:284 (+) Transcript_6383:1043-1894(+)
MARTFSGDWPGWPANTGARCWLPTLLRRAYVLGDLPLTPCATLFIAITALTAPLNSFPASRSFLRFFWTLSRCTRGVIGVASQPDPFVAATAFGARSTSHGCVASARSAVIRCDSSTVKNFSMRSFASLLTFSHTGDCVKLKLPVRISSYMACSSSCANGVYPASSTKRSTPHAQLSTDGPCACGTDLEPFSPLCPAPWSAPAMFASSTSGEMYSGVPEGRNLLRALAFLARPRSHIFTLSRSVLDASSKFSSFKSQCVTPTSCRYRTPSRILRKMRLAMCSS